MLPTPMPFSTVAPEPTTIPIRPTDPPPGSADNPLNFTLVSVSAPAALDDDVSALRDALEAATGLTVDVQVADSYAPVLAGLCNRSVHIGTLDAFGYLVASQQGCATPAFVAERDGEATTQGQLIANSESLIANVDSFRGRRFCRSGPDSVHGWLVPGVTLRSRGIDPLNELDAVVDAGSDEAVVRLVHDRECDVGATLLGAEEAVEDLERPELVAFIEALAPIPNETVVFGSALTEDVKSDLLEALTETEDSLLDVLESDALVAARDRDYDELREVFSAAGVDVVALAR